MRPSGGIAADDRKPNYWFSSTDGKFQTMYKPGDRIVYLSSKHSSHPTPRAVEVRPEPAGEFYSYEVLKYWVVAAIQPDGNLVAVTRRGKRRNIHIDDPALRHARWWERLLFRNRFPEWPVPPQVEPKRRVQRLSYE